MTRHLIALYVVSLPFEYLWVRLFGSTTELKPYRVIAAALVVVWLVERLGAKRREPLLRLDAYDGALLFLLLGGLGMAAFWHVVGQADLGRAVDDTLLGGFALVTYFVIKNSDTGPGRLDKGSAVSNRPRRILGLERLLDLYVYAVSASILLHVALGLPSAAERFPAFSESSNRLAFSITVALHVLVAKTLFGARPGAPAAYLVRGALALGLLIALLFTGSRGAMFAFVLSLPLHGVALAARSRRRGRSRAQLAALAPLVLVGGIAVAATLGRYGDQASGLRRLDRTGIDATSGRYDIWRSALTASADYYFLGMGTGQYRAQHREYVKRLDVIYKKTMAENDLGTHNDVLEVLTSSGLIGVVLFVAMLVSLFQRLRAHARARGEPGWLYPSLVPIFGLLVLSGMTHIFLRSPHFFLLLAVMMQAVRSAPSRPRRPAERRAWPGQLSAAEITRRVARPS